MRRSHALLAGAVALAGGAVLAAGPDRTPAAQLAGAPLDRAREAATFEGLADSVAKAAPQATGPAAGKSARTEPDVDLDRMTREGDHYVAPTKDGKKAVLTLDPELQELAQKLLNQSRAPRGAIVLMARDGRILALAGRKTDEPKGSREGTFDWRLATEAWAPAASVFKLVTASALVGAGVDPDADVCYHGGIRSVLEHNLQDDKRDSRCESLTYGVAHSQNAILGKLAFQKLDPQALASEVARIGWTSKLPPLLPGKAGEFTVPKARDLEHARTAAGFAKTTKLSAVGGALVAATFADEGKQPTPRIVASIDGVAAPNTPPRRALPAGTARAVARMMAQTCVDGSAAKIFQRKKKVSVAGKTGTLTRTDPFYMEHSWFVGFAPADQPELVVSVILGNPESWHLRGHEAAKRMIDEALGERTARAKRDDKDHAIAAAK